MAGAQASTDARAEEAHQQIERWKEEAKPAATQKIKEILGPEVDIEPEDWDVVTAGYDSEGGPQAVIVANTEIEGIPVTVKWHFGAPINARNGTPEIGEPIAEGEDIEGRRGTYLTRESFGWALRARERRQE